MKYVIFNRSDQKDLAVVFDANIFHNDIRIRGGRPVSAGFITVQADGVKCFGESESLNIKSREEDAAIVEKMMAINTPAKPIKEDKYVQTRTPNKRKRQRSRKSHRRDVQREDA